MHENSITHKSAALTYHDFLTVTPINEQIDASAAAEAASCLRIKHKKNREDLYHIIDIIVTLVRTGHPLRGRDEKVNSQNRSIFLELTSLLGRYDPFLHEHLDTCPRNALYTSNIIQNDLIFECHV